MLRAVKTAVNALRGGLALEVVASSRLQALRMGRETFQDAVMEALAAPVRVNAAQVLPPTS